ncbi:MAG: divalent metal cation transporter [Myxococcota bacterium]
MATCTLAGARSGYGLLWALIFSILATLVLQDMAVRLGARTGMGLATALVRGRGPFLRGVIASLVLGALLVGNAAYEAGNMTGALLGLELLVGPSLPRLPGLLILGAGASMVLWSGGLGSLQRVLAAVVLAMSLAFGVAYLGSASSPASSVSGMAPRSEAELAVALVGTTIVPYNLFLHAAAVRVEGEGARLGGAFAIALGGLVSFFILGTAAELPGQTIQSPLDLARGLESSMGVAGRYALGLGLLAAGSSSALTAPLAAGLVVGELFPGTRWSRRARLLVVACGVLYGGTELDPLALIVTAQAANGLLLPVVIVFLLAAMNRRDLLGREVNGWAANLAGVLVLIVGLCLGLRLLGRAFG